MTYFYHMLGIYTFAFVVSIPLTAVFFMLVRRITDRIPVTVPSMVGAGFIIFMIVLLMGNPLLYNLQIAIAAPFVEEAAGRQCDTRVFALRDGAFYNDSRFGWASFDGKTTCNFNGGEWICRC